MLHAALPGKSLHSLTLPSCPQSKAFSAMQLLFIPMVSPTGSLYCHGATAGYGLSGVVTASYCHIWNCRLMSAGDCTANGLQRAERNQERTWPKPVRAACMLQRTHTHNSTLTTSACESYVLRAPVSVHKVVMNKCKLQHFTNLLEQLSPAQDCCRTFCPYISNSKSTERQM